MRLSSRVRPCAASHPGTPGPSGARGPHRPRPGAGRTQPAAAGSTPLVRSTCCRQGLPELCRPADRRRLPGYRWADPRDRQIGRCPPGIHRARHRLGTAAAARGIAPEGGGGPEAGPGPPCLDQDPLRMPGGSTVVQGSGGCPPGGDPEGTLRAHARRDGADRLGGALTGIGLA